MRYAVLVRKPDHQPTIYGSFRTPEAAALVADRAATTDAAALTVDVLPINPSRAFTHKHPADPIPGHE